MSVSNETSNANANSNSPTPGLTALQQQRREWFAAASQSYGYDDIRKWSASAPRHPDDEAEATRRSATPARSSAKSKSKLWLWAALLSSIVWAVSLQLSKDEGSERKKAATAQHANNFVELRGDSIELTLVIVQELPELAELELPQEFLPAKKILTGKSRNPEACNIRVHLRPQSDSNNPYTIKIGVNGIDIYCKDKAGYGMALQHLSKLRDKNRKELYLRMGNYDSDSPSVGNQAAN